MPRATPPPPAYQLLYALVAIAGVTTVILGTVFVLFQQSARQAANDAPLAAAQSVRIQLASGKQAVDVTPRPKIELNRDLGVFVIITDAKHKILDSSATLDGQAALPPAGVFDYTSAHGQDAFTWQPAGGVRLATVVLKYSAGGTSGFIVAGQPLSQVEGRINLFAALLLSVWLGIMVWLSVIFYVFSRHHLPKPATKPTSRRRKNKTGTAQPRRGRK